MGAVGELATRLIDILTGFQARILYSAVEDDEIIVIEDDEVHVYWFSSDTPVLGQATVFGTIILNRQRIAGLSDYAKNYVLFHEWSHKARSPIFKGILYGTVILAALAGLLIIRSVQYTIFIFQGYPVWPLAILLGVASFFLFTFLFTNNVEEMLADLTALRHIGRDEFLRAKEEISNQREPTLRGKVIVWFLYPKPTTVVRFHDLTSRWI